MKDLIEAAREVETWLEANGWRFCFIGGLANLRWGEPRLTRDADLALFTGFGEEEPYIQALLDRYPARIEDAAAFARRNRVVLARMMGGADLDLSLAGLPFEERMITRGSEFSFMPDAALRTCSAEDLVITKAFADRERDWLDIRGVLIRQGETLDWRIILEELPPLCALKERPEIVARLEALRLNP